MTHCSITTVVSQQISRLQSYGTCIAKMLHNLIQPLCSNDSANSLLMSWSKSAFSADMYTNKLLANFYRKSVNSFLVFDKDEAA